MAQTPANFRIEHIVSEATYGKFVVNPLLRGYGTTVGNALRRILLSSVPGAAITAILLDGIQHEFATIPGVREDATQLILNLKDIAVHCLSELDPSEAITLRLVKNGPGIVTAADIQCPADVEIVNPEVYLATLNDEQTSLSMELFVQMGTAYVAPDKVVLPGNRQNTIGVIPIGGYFSPVRKVNHIVESTRVGFRTDLERLTLEITTNGTILPQDALRQAALIMRKFIDPFCTAHEEGLPQIGDGSQLPDGVEDRAVQDLGFSQRTLNCLNKASVSMLSILVDQSDSGLLGIRNFGQKSLREVKRQLALVDTPLMLKDPSESDLKLVEALKKPISDLDVDESVKNALQGLGFTNLRSLVQKSAEDLQMDEETLQMIRKALKQFNWTLSGEDREDIKVAGIPSAVMDGSEDHSTDAPEEADEIPAAE
ncbi:MAG: DNA-directed RNA polymerase subunit alpha [Armatimonadota bacterium]